MTAFVLGLLAGLATIGLSELLIKFWGSRPVHRFWKVLLVGSALRALWVLGLLAAVLTSGVLEPRPFVIALLGSYLVAQVLEGLRHQHLIRTR